MKKLLLLITLFLAPILMHAQGSDLIIGSWKWSNAQYEGVAFFDDIEYEMKLNLRGTQSRVSEIFRYYKIENNKIFFASLPFDTSFENDIAEYLIEKIEANTMILIDSNGNRDLYNRVSADKPKIQKIRINEFDATSGAIVCATLESGIDYMPCLCFGQIDFNSSLSDIEKMHGKAYKTIENIDGSETRIYLLETDSELYPYFAITFKDGLIGAIQLTGERPKEDISFSSIRLGDHENFVKQKLGLPSSKNEVNEIQGEMWDYFPFPITIEIKNNLVYSIRLKRKS